MPHFLLYTIRTLVTWQDKQMKKSQENGAPYIVARVAGADALLILSSPVACVFGHVAYLVTTELEM